MCDQGKTSSDPDKEHEQRMWEYRQSLLKSQTEMIDEFGKAMLSLAGGGLGISMVFVSDVIKLESTESRQLLILSWIAWGISITAILVSYYTSHLAIRVRLKQLDEKKPLRDSWLNKVTVYASPFSIACFFAGTILMTAFVAKNTNPKTTTPPIQTPTNNAPRTN